MPTMPIDAHRHLTLPQLLKTAPGDLRRDMWRLHMHVYKFHLRYKGVIDIMIPQPTVPVVTVYATILSVARAEPQQTKGTHFLASYGD